ncbi:E3 ubiquitin-protein ligase huwe1, variant 2 [Homalodisca vitripennis]|nr:E3 ubiquitin-protein ligase huwe1, variant 2 [Homalodisca vitripennis]
MDDEEDNNKKACTSSGETEKKKLYDGIMDMFEPTPRPPARTPRRIAMLAAAQEVAQATESLAGSIVESVLHPRNPLYPPNVRPLLPIQPPGGPSSPPQEPTDQSQPPTDDDNSSAVVVHFVSPQRTQASSIPEALELIPVAQSLPELSDPMGLIPGSVPYQPPGDPEDGFYRVNPALLVNSRNENSDIIEIRESNENGSSSDSEPMVPTSEARALNNDYRILGTLPVDMTSSGSGGSQFLINSGGGTMVAIGQGNEALEIEMAATWLQSQMAAQSSPIEDELFEQPLTQPSSQSQAEVQPEPLPDSPPHVIRSPDYSPPPPPPMPLPMEPSTGANPVLSIASQSSFLSEEIPEGVDPSFLAALPEDMRAEVLSEHLRLQRLQNRVQQNTEESSQFPQGTSSGMEVNADFLAALPPAIQEEVLAQQRLEQQRQAAALCNPNDPVDAAAFFQDLPHSLRQAILTDMEESQISVLPPDLAAEAQNLRREWEARNRQLMQERFLSHVTHTSALSSILRHSSTPRNIRRPTGPRYTIQNMMNPSNRTHWLSSWNLGTRLLDGVQSGSQVPSLGASITNSNIMGRPRGRQVLDYESISCLLVLLFVDDSRLNTARLHRVFRNLCYHPPTREWVIRAILSIMEKSNEGQGAIVGELPQQNTGAVRRVTRSQTQPGSNLESSTTSSSPSSLMSSSSSSWNATRSGSSWLNISMDAALGCRATVFHVHKNPGRRNDKSITINPQAAPFVYRHALDILISLARIFPSYFVPGKAVASPNSSAAAATSLPKTSKSPRPDNTSNFWDLLIRLDSLSTSKKGKTAARPSTTPASDPENLCLESSPFGQLLKMLASPVVHRSPLLMDKLLRLLSLISISLQVHKQRLWDKVEVNPVTLHHLGLAINVLTSNTCSEEGLEDATALLLNMTVNLANTRETVLNLLLDGARNMASIVCVHIESLLNELRVLNSQQVQNDELEDNSVDSRLTSLKGILSNRFTKDTVVVTAPKKVKAGLDLQLNSMAPLISKTSSQAFFLRILKVIVQLRESVRNFDKKKRKQAAEMASSGGTQSSDPTTSSSDPSSQDDIIPPSQEVPMDTSPPSSNFMPTSSGTGEDEGKSEKSDDTPLPPLSEQLNLDILWNTLSECLTELQHTQDNHAVLVLQPAVEAFFLVHASGMEKPETSRGSGAEERIVTERVVTERASVDRERQPSGTINSPNNRSQSQGGLGLDGLTPAPPPVSPLPSDPANDVQPSTSSSYFSNLSQGSESLTPVPPHQLKFLKFAETHRTVLNQILRQCTTPLLEGPFAVLVNHTRVLDFDVKRRYFRGELERADEGHRREELAVHVRRTQVFEDSFRELHRRTPDEWKNRFYIVFEGEEGQDAGGLLREWYMIISREIFNPMYALFTTSPGDRVTYMINPSSHCNPNHLCYFKFVGRVIAKAIYDNKLLECYFTRSFYKHILGILVKYTDMESEDYTFYQGLVFLMENPVDSIGYEPTFSTEVQEFGVTEIRDLIPNGRNLLVTEENKMEYIRLVCQMKMTGAIRKQLNAFLEGFYDIIPMRLISIFNEQELELLISGLPNVDIEDLKANTEYYKYQPNSLQIQWFWRALREFDQAERAKFLQFVTGTSKVPLQGFAALEGMNGVQKFQIHRDERSTDRLPSAHTCFNQLDLPVYETYTKLRLYLLKAIHECSEGFGFA